MVWAVLLLLGFSLPAAQSNAKQSRPHSADADGLGMTCAQILGMSSTEWMAKVASVDDSNADGQLRGIKSYGTCYDGRTDQLGASLARSRKGPRAAEKRSLQDLMAALDDFTATALTDSQPPGDPVKKAYAALYEKQFRYEFYQSYEVKKPAQPEKAAAPPPPAPPIASASAATDANSAAEGKAPAAPVSEMTRAKNRFGELLDALPPDKLHEVHAAFGKVLDVQPLASTQELAIYRYAIFVLEPAAPPASAIASASSTVAAKQVKPFAPPPF